MEFVKSLPFLVQVRATMSYNVISLGIPFLPTLEVLTVLFTIIVSHIHVLLKYAYDRLCIKNIGYLRVGPIYQNLCVMGF